MTGPLAQILDSWNYLVVIVLMMGGLFIVISQTNLVKKLVGLAIFQTSVFLFYISAGKIAGGTAPILTDAPGTIYSNPLPHVLILTAIVVGVATVMFRFSLPVADPESSASLTEGDISLVDLKHHVGELDHTDLPCCDDEH